jgi:hypothetical protein
MRILILTNSFPSKSETFIANHVYGLAKKGHDVIVRIVYCSTRKKRFAGIASVLQGIRYALFHPIRFGRVIAQMRLHYDAAVSQAFAAARYALRHPLKTARIIACAKETGQKSPMISRWRRSVGRLDPHQRAWMSNLTLFSGSAS